ncbi:MAG: glycosyltransferase family 2 protein [Cytophagales bacterium]|nr:glycosyltransferase family 2 protein [Cytophagales bacterium]
MYTVAVVILNWNGKHHLQKFLPSVYAHSKNAQIYIIDNASADGSVSYLKDNFPDIKIIQLSQNHGFCAGYNIGLKQIQAEYYILLNNDVEIQGEWLSPLIIYMQSNKNCAACQPKILSYTNPTYFEYAGAAGGYIDRLGYPYCRGRIFHTIEQDTGQYDDIVEIDWATGACMCVRADVFHNLGGFDELFFAHMEEIDLCWRMKNNGYCIVVVPQSKVYHLGAGTLQKDSATKIFLNYRNGLYLLHKNLPYKYLIVNILARLFLDGISAMPHLLSARADCVWAILRAHIQYYKHLTQLHNVRKYTKSQYMPCVKSIVWQYFIKNKKLYALL